MHKRKPLPQRMAAAMAVQAPTSAQVANIVPELTDKWSRTTLMSLERLENAIRADDGLQAKYWATAAGIGTDKIMPLKGMPTQIVSNINEYRVELGPLLERMAVAARVVQVHQRKGYLAASAASVPVILPHLDDQNALAEAEVVTICTSDDATGQASEHSGK